MAYLITNNVHLYQSSPLTFILTIVIIIPLTLLHLPGVASQSVVDCRKNSESCVCSSPSIVEYFSEILFVPATVYRREPNVIFENIERFHCPEFIPLPSHLQIRMPESGEIPPPSHYYYSRRRRKYRQKRSLNGEGGKSRRKRQISLGYPTEELFEEVIASIPPSSKSHHYAVLGSEVTLHCYGEGRNGWEEQGVSGSFRNFEWTHGNDQPITAPLVQFDQSTGDLKLVSVRLADTGIYTCMIRSGEDESAGRGGDVEMRKFKSQLDVIAAPMWWLRFWMTYSTDRCRQRELLEIQRQIKDVIHQYVCHFCPVRNMSVHCVNPGRGNDDGVKYVEISLTLSTLGFERLLPQWEHASYMCPVDCQEFMHSKLFTILLGSLTKLFNLEIFVEPIDGQTSVYTPQPQSMNDDIAMGCPSGFFENYKLCFPCAAGQYSPHGKAECAPCKEGFFQPNPGSSDCFRCPKGHTTLEEGARSQMDCVSDALSGAFKFSKFHWMVVCISGGALLFLLLIMIMACCCCPNSCLGKCCRCVWCCGEDDDNEGESGKSGRPTVRKGQYEKLISEPEQPAEEYYGNEEIEREEFAEVHEGRGGGGGGRSKHKRGRPMKYPRFPREDYNYDDDDRSTHKNGSGPSEVKQESESESESVNEEQKTFKERLESFEQKSSEPSRVRGGKTFSKPIRQLPPLNLKHSKPSKPTYSKNSKYPPGVLPICNYPIPDMSHHQLSEQIPPRPYLEEEADELDDSSSTSSRFRKIPHLKFGNVLNKSKSLMVKLDEQRRKLGEEPTDRSSSSDRTSDSSKSPPRRPPRHPSQLPKRSLPKSSSQKHRVNILEHKNTYHNYKGSKSKASKVRESDSSIFKKPVSERIKSFQNGGKRRRR